MYYITYYNTDKFHESTVKTKDSNSGASKYIPCCPHETQPPSNSDTISQSLKQRHEIPLVNNSDIEIYIARARYVHTDPFNRKPQEEILRR